MIRKAFNALMVPCPLIVVVALSAFIVEAQPYYRTVLSGGGSVGSGGEINLPQDASQAASPTLNWGDGDTGWWEESDDVLRFGVGGTARWAWQTNYFQGVTTGGASIYRSAGVVGAAAHTFVGDENTGIYQQAAGNIGFTCDGTECVRMEHPADLAATETSLFIYDLDNATLEQVSVGAADSGGSGYKVLRILN